MVKCLKLTLTLLHSEWLKLSWVLAMLSTVGLNGLSLVVNLCHTYTTTCLCLLSFWFDFVWENLTWYFCVIIGWFMQESAEYLSSHGHEDCNGTENMVCYDIQDQCLVS